MTSSAWQIRWKAGGGLPAGYQGRRYGLCGERPGEAKEADLGIAGGIGEGLLIKKGEIIRKVPEGELLAVLKEELDNWKA